MPQNKRPKNKLLDTQGYTQNAFVFYYMLEIQTEFIERFIMVHQSHKQTRVDLWFHFAQILTSNRQEKIK